MKTNILLRQEQLTEGNKNYVFLWL